MNLKMGKKAKIIAESCMCELILVFQSDALCRQVHDI